MTLSLGVLGSTVLPVPFAVSRVGLLTGALTMLLVAWANDVTSCLLVRAAAYTGHDTYEQLAFWAGGRRWKVGGGGCWGWVCVCVGWEYQTIMEQAEVQIDGSDVCCECHLIAHPAHPPPTPPRSLSNPRTLNTAFC